MLTNLITVAVASLCIGSYFNSFRLALAFYCGVSALIGAVGDLALEIRKVRDGLPK